MNSIAKNAGVRGRLILIGGGEDRRDERIVLKRTLSENSAKNVVIIPTASSYERELGGNYVEIFKSLGAQEAWSLEIRYAEEADKPEFLEKVKIADLIFFTGGDQTKLVPALRNNKIFTAIRNRFDAGATIAGTSAGAASASDPMIYSGDDRGFFKGAIKSAKGFGWLPGVVVDTHFTERHRLPRLVQALSMGIARFGLGLGEDTGIVINHEDHFETIGKGFVTAVATAEGFSTNYERIEENDLITTDGVRLSYLVPGTRFDLNEWCVIPS